jgi:hypothetical protein
MSLIPSAFSGMFSGPGPRRSAVGKRASPRQRQNGLTCNLGQIIDLSSTGARVRCRSVVSGRVDVILTDYTRSGELRAEVIWLKNAGAFHYEAGLRFHKMSREMAGRLNSIAMEHRFRRVG